MILKLEPVTIEITLNKGRNLQVSKAQPERFNYLYDLIYEGEEITGEGVVTASSPEDAYSKAWDEVFYENDLKEGTPVYDKDGNEIDFLPNDFKLNLELQRWQDFDN